MIIVGSTLTYFDAESPACIGPSGAKWRRMKFVKSHIIFQMTKAPAFDAHSINL
jgi:hypothetical protein